MEMSVEPPGPKGTMKRMGLAGHGASARTMAGAATMAAEDRSRERRPMALEVVELLRITLPFTAYSAAARAGRIYGSSVSKACHTACTSAAPLPSRLRPSISFLFTKKRQWTGRLASSVVMAS